MKTVEQYNNPTDSKGLERSASDACTNACTESQNDSAAASVQDLAQQLKALSREERAALIAALLDDDE